MYAYVIPHRQRLGNSLAIRLAQFYTVQMNVLLQSNLYHKLSLGRANFLIQRTRLTPCFANSKKIKIKDQSTTKVLLAM